MKLLFDQNLSSKLVNRSLTCPPDSLHVKDLGLEQTDKLFDLALVIVSAMSGTDFSLSISIDATDRLKSVPLMAETMIKAFDLGGPKQDE